MSSLFALDAALALVAVDWREIHRKGVSVVNAASRGVAAGCGDLGDAAVARGVGEERLALHGGRSFANQVDGGQFHSMG